MVKLYISVFYNNNINGYNKSVVLFLFFIWGRGGHFVTIIGCFWYLGSVSLFLDVFCLSRILVFQFFGVCECLMSFSSCCRDNFTSFNWALWLINNKYWHSLNAFLSQGPLDVSAFGAMFDPSLILTSCRSYPSFQVSTNSRHFILFGFLFL